MMLACRAQARRCATWYVESTGWYLGQIRDDMVGGVRCIDLGLVAE